MEAARHRPRVDNASPRNTPRVAPAAWAAFPTRQAPASVSTQHSANHPRNRVTVRPSIAPANRGSRRPSTRSRANNPYPTPESPTPGPDRAYPPASDPMASRRMTPAAARWPRVASTTVPNVHSQYRLNARWMRLTWGRAEVASRQNWPSHTRASISSESGSHPAHHATVAATAASATPAVTGNRGKSRSGGVVRRRGRSRGTSGTAAAAGGVTWAGSDRGGIVKSIGHPSTAELYSSTSSPARPSASRHPNLPMLTSAAGPVGCTAAFGGRHLAGISLPPIDFTLSRGNTASPYPNPGSSFPPTGVPLRTLTSPPPTGSRCMTHVLPFGPVTTSTKYDPKSTSGTSSFGRHAFHRAAKSFPFPTSPSAGFLASRAGSATAPDHPTAALTGSAPAATPDAARITPAISGTVQPIT